MMIVFGLGILLAIPSLSFSAPPGAYSFPPDRAWSSIVDGDPHEVRHALLRIGRARISMSDLTPQQLELLASKEFRHAVAVAARVALMRRAAARGDVLAWGAAAMPEKFNLPFCSELHGYMVSIRKEPIASTKAPRGFAKTTIGCNLIPLYQALVEPKLYNFYLNVQANDTKALAVNRAIKAELEDNTAIRAAYGNQVTHRWTDAEFELRNGAVFKSVGAGCSLRGLQYRNRRPDYVLLDDAYDENEIHNLEATERVNTWIKGTLYKVLARSRGHAFHVSGTTINELDILTAMEKWPGCKSRTFSAIRDDGKSLWPELYTDQELREDLERMGSVIFNRELLNVVTSDAESIVKSAWLKNWEYNPEVKWPQLSQTREVRIETVVMGCDPSTGEKETGDPAGFATVIKTRGPGTRFDYFIEDLHCEPMSWDARLAQLERMQAHQNARGAEHRVKRAYVESIAGFKDFGNQAKAKTSLPVDLVTWVKGKKANLAAKSGHFEFGRVHISCKIPKHLRDTLHSQLTQNEPKHDDLRDAVLLCLEDPMTSMRDWV